MSDTPDAAVQQFLASDTPEAPKMPTPETGFFRLPGGYSAVGKGSVEYQAEVRELNGDDEEYIDRVKRGKPTKFAEAILERGLVRLGAEKVTKAVLAQMLLGDAEKALLEIRRATYGDSLEYESLTCPHCRERFNLTLTLDDIPERKLDNPAEAQFRVPLRKGGHALVRLPRLSDIPEVDGDATDAEVNTAHLANVVLSIEKGGEVSPINGSVDAARHLGVADRRAILTELAKRKIGPMLDEVSFTHDVCGKEVPFPLAPGDLFPGL